jgi:predicted HNH restriction endonuclease
VTFKRNISEDQASTKLAIKDWLGGNKRKSTKSWLGHSEGARNLDFMLIDGATKEELEGYRGAVDKHIYHLRKEHGVNVLKVSGKYILEDSFSFQESLEKEIFPDDAPKEFFEGATSVVKVNRYERSSAARKACIEYHGCSCSVCSMDFLSLYGERGKGFIHVHHVTPVSSVGEKYILDPVNDLRPVCPNCHAMLHADPPCTIDELKRKIKI